MRVARAAMAVLLVTCAAARAQGPARGVVSSSVAEDWEGGMVTGNGRMGAVVYGRPETPVVVLNQNRLYTSSLDPKVRRFPDVAQFVPEIRRLVHEKGYPAALDYSFEKSRENGLSPGEPVDFHPGAILQFKIEGGELAGKYARATNFETGEVVTSWEGKGGTFETRVFASRADGVVVMSVRGPAGGWSGHVSLGAMPSKLVRESVSSGKDWVGFHDLYAEGNGGYDGAIRAVCSGGTCEVRDGTMSVVGAKELLLVARIDRWRPPEDAGSVEGVLKEVAGVAGGYEALLAPHAKAHGEMYGRARLDLGGGADRALTSDELLARARREKALPAALMEKMFDACRYEVLCSSGDLPPNLQGIWTGTWAPAWHGDYSADANLQLAVDATVPTNMPEAMAGYFDLIERGVPSWREAARRMAGCRGILYPARMNDEGTYFQQNKEWQWFNQVAIAGWLGHYFYDYYAYTGDKAFLEKRAIPYLKECALFYEDWYPTDASGHLRATPSMSYESALADNATVEFAVVREVLTNLIRGCEELGIEKEGVARWRALLAKVPPYMVNGPENVGGPAPSFKPLSGSSPAVADGTLKEFVLPGMVEFPSHRHLSALYPLFVSYEFSPEETPGLWEAARLHYERKIASMKGTETHYRLQGALCAARLGKGDDAWGFLTALATHDVFHASLVPSHFDNQKVFNCDASGGVPSVVYNCLVFSQPGRLDVLPALPSAWAKGEIRGILGRGRIVIDSLAWDVGAGKVSLELSSAVEQKVVVSLPAGASGTMAANGVGVAVRKTGAGRNGAELDLARGRTRVEMAFAPVAGREGK